MFKNVSDSRKNNESIKRAEASAREAAAIQARQLTAQQQQERTARIAQARRSGAAIIAAAGGSGFDLSSGDFIDATNANQAFASQDLNTLGINLQSNLDRVRSGLDANLVSLDSGKTNLFADGFTGALAGASTGLSLGESFDRIANNAQRQADLLAISRGDTPENPAQAARWGQLGFNGGTVGNFAQGW